MNKSDVSNSSMYWPSRDEFIYEPFDSELPLLRDRQLNYLCWRMDRANFQGNLREYTRYSLRYHKLCHRTYH